MTILHVDTGREMRGGQHQVMILMRGLRERGHVSLLLSREASPLSEKAAAEKFSVYPAEVKELWQRSRTVDVVHAHDARAHSLAAIAAQKRFVVSRRVSFPVQQTLLSRLKYGRAARYLAISQFVKSRLEQAGVSSDCIDVVYDAAENNVEVSAWKPCKAVVAPAFRNDPKKLSGLAEQACRFAGYPLLLSNHLMRDLPEAGVFLYLTRSEGLGSAAILAMAVGVPVIASRVEGLAEVFEHGSSGLYIDGEDAQSIAGEIRNVIEQPELALQLRQGGLDRVRQQFSPTTLTAHTLQSYERALAR